MAEHEHPSDRSRSAEDREALREIARLIAERNEAADQGDDAATSDRPGSAAEPTGGDEVVATAAKNPEGRALALLLDTVPAAAAVCIGRELRFTNPAFALAFGYRSVEELLAAGGLGRVFGASVAKLFAEIEKQGDRGGASEMEIDARTESGRNVAMPLGVHVGGEAETRVALLILRPAEDLPDPDQDSDPQPDILAKVSHEVRTPLNSIIGFAELLKEQRFGPLGHPKYLAYAEDICESGQYALEIIGDLLDLSKIKAGKLQINFTAVNLNELVHECVHLVELQARAERVVVRTSLEDPLSPVLADQRSLKQILLNLLSNALKFTEAGGQVIVSTLPGEDGSLLLRIRDTGIGMSEADIARAMKPFQQLDTAPQRVAGTGLGLTLTQALAEANRASLQLESAPGAGTCVDLVFASARVLKE